MRRARPFVSWLLVTGRLTAGADFLALADLRLGLTARKHLPDTHAWFAGATARVGAPGEDTALQWNALCKIAALSGTRPDEIDTERFLAARSRICDAYALRGKPEAGRNVRSIFHRLQLTLFHAGKIDSLARAVVKPPVSVTGWEPITPRYRDNALRYVEQVRLSLRPATVKHIEQHLRVFGTWLAEHHPNIGACADLERHHVEAFKTWLAAQPSKRTGKPLTRTSIKEQLINLGCFFDRITNWGYPDAPTRPLLFVGDLPLIDQPLPRFLDDAAAAKLCPPPAIRARPARPALRRDARPHRHPPRRTPRPHRRRRRSDRLRLLAADPGRQAPQRPLHPAAPRSSRTCSTTGSRTTGPPACAATGCCIEHGRPITSTARRDRAQPTSPRDAGIGHVTPHQLRHTLATQAINRGMSLEAIAALLGHKTLAMTMVYARIADKTVADEYFAVTEKVEALYGQPQQLPADDEGTEMRRLRAEMHRRMLGNGYCARPVEMDCHFESICESCTFFVTTIEFRPTLRKPTRRRRRQGPNRPPEDLRRSPQPPRRRSLVTMPLDAITRISTTPTDPIVLTAASPPPSSRPTTTVRTTPKSTRSWEKPASTEPGAIRSSSARIRRSRGTASCQPSSAKSPRTERLRAGRTDAASLERPIASSRWRSRSRTRGGSVVEARTMRSRRRAPLSARPAIRPTAVPVGTSTNLFQSRSTSSRATS